MCTRKLYNSNIKKIHLGRISLVRKYCKKAPLMLNPSLDLLDVVSECPLLRPVNDLQRTPFLFQQTSTHH